MALKLHQGGAPAGPAGKGKSETTKDLAHAHAIPCYMFNCSNQMNFSPLVTFFEASPKLERLDEFNRIQIEILSVVATQVKTIQDAIVNLSRPEKKARGIQIGIWGDALNKVGYFVFMGDTISLIPTCGFLFTMNPGYASRTELPENLKAFVLLLRHDLSRFFRRANRTPVNRAFRSSKVVDNISVYWWPRARRYLC